MTRGQRILGAGWKTPMEIAEDGTVALSRYEDSVRESILTILGTRRGERQMRPEFGCDIHELVFSDHSMTSAGLAAFYVEKALTQWEPRIEALSVLGRPDPRESRLLIEIEYRVIRTNTVFNLVYPFYLLEGAAE